MASSTKTPQRTVEGLSSSKLVHVAVCTGLLASSLVLTVSFAKFTTHVIEDKSQSVKKTNVTPTQQQQKEREGPYQPSTLEDYVYSHAKQLGYTKTGSRPTAFGCQIWTNEANNEIYTDLHTFRSEMDQYWKAVDQYSWIQDQGIQDLRPHVQEPNFCEHLQVNSTLLSTKSSSFLSYTPTAGYVEPSLPPMRHEDYCMSPRPSRETINNIRYLVHDFSHMCRQLKPHSRTVLLDFGASPKYVGAASPWYEIMKLFQTKFGFHFDHVYAYEINQFDIKEVFESIPSEFHTALHWINTGVMTEEGSAFNPWTMLERDYNEDDFVVVKLDIDTASFEIPLAQQLLTNDKLRARVDQFYFEHHVEIEEMRPHWARTWKGSIKDSLELFRKLREGGVPAHFWV